MRRDVHGIIMCGAAYLPINYWTKITRGIQYLYYSKRQVNVNNKPQMDNRDDIIALLKNVNIFSRLDDEELAEVARFSRWMRYGSGETVFSEGGPATQMYIVKEGEVLVSKRSADGKSVPLASFIAGDCFGELDMFENAPRPATAVAESGAVLLAFPMEGASFQKTLENSPHISASILLKLLAIVAGRIRSTNRLISEKVRWIQELRQQLYTDKLTGLYNRTYLDEEFDNRLASYRIPACVLFIKPDNFKTINDSFGHDAGDAVLRRMAKTISTETGGDDIVVRYRGDEFALVLLSRDMRESAEIAERLRVQLLELDIRDITGGDVPVAVSIGVSAWPGDAPSGAALIERAYERMFVARNNGGNAVCMAP